MGTVTESERLALRQWAGEHMNEQTAEAFMKSLPPKGWDDLATKIDLEALGLRFTAQLATEIGKLHEKIGDMGRAQWWQTLTILIAILLAIVGQTALERA